MQCLCSNNADFLLHRFRLSKSLQDRTLCPNKTFNDTTITISVKKKKGRTRENTEYFDYKKKIIISLGFLFLNVIL